jgi:hypothetical protein
MSGGFTGTSIGTANDTTYVWNGSSWSTVATMNDRRAVGFGMGGQQDSCFVNGGQDGSGGTQLFSSEEYDGSANTWTSKSASTYGGQGSVGAGDVNSFARCGGHSSGGVSNQLVETWDSSSWTTTSHSFPHGDSYNYGTSCGVGIDSFMQGARDSGTGVGKIYKYDGNSWTDSGSATLAPKYIGMGGDSSSAIMCGGWSSGKGSSYYDGSTWSSTNDLNTARSTSGTGGITA